MSINPSIFKAYDVRGVYPGEINEETFYFAVNKAKADGGAMVTASHNPAKYNGLKFTLKQARPVGEETGLEEIKAFALRAKFAASVKKGTLKKKLLFKKYVNFMLWQIKNIEMPDLKIAIDSGNGMAGLILPKLFKKIKRIKVFPLYFKIDCGFPNHEANPLKEETLNDLKNLMRKKKADAGIAFDGDGDRVVFLTAEGRPARADFITALLAGEYLKKYPKAKIAFGVNSSRVVREA